MISINSRNNRNYFIEIINYSLIFQKLTIKIKLIDTSPGFHRGGRSYKPLFRLTS